MHVALFSGALIVQLLNEMNRSLLKCYMLSSVIILLNIDLLFINGHMLLASILSTQDF